MARRRTLVRGGITLAVLAAVAGAMVVAPAGAHVTNKFGHLKKHINQIAKKQATQVFNQSIGPATAGFLTTGSILVQAQDDPTPNVVTATGDELINTVSINAPSSGFLIISGTAFVNNNEAAAGYYALEVRLDGTLITTGNNTFVDSTSSELGADGVGTNDEETLAYTNTRAVSAGNHTITQTIDADTEAFDYNYDAAELTVLFVPSGGVARVAAKASGAATGGGAPD